MILDTEKLPRISSHSESTGSIDLELEDECPELDEAHGREVIFLAMFCDGLVIVRGRVLSYERVEADPELMEQDILARVSFARGMSITINY